MLDLHYLRIFYEVAKEKSFSKAAGNLYINQSAVSIQIKKFEETLSTKLFDRTNSKKIELTYAGEVLFRTAEEIFQKVGRVEKEINQVIQFKKGKIIIGATHIIGEPLLPKIIKQFTDKYPEIEYEIYIQERDILLQWLKEGKIDVFLLGDYYISDKTFSIIPINDFPFVLVYHQEISSLKELEHIPMINRNDSIILEKKVDFLESKYGIKIEKRITVNGSIETIKNLVIERMGYSILPYYCVYDELLTKKLYTILSFEEYKNGYQAVVVKDKLDKYEINLFIDFIKDFNIERDF